MFPLRDHHPSPRSHRPSRRDIVTWSLIVVNVAIHLLITLPISGDPVLYRFYLDWAMIPRLITMGESYHGLVTSIFLHADIWHLAGNMLFLWIFGDNLEEELGRFGFLVFYLLSGVAAGLAQWLADPMSVAPTIGASGAIAGVMGGYLLLFPRAKIDVVLFFVFFIRIVPVSAWVILSIWLVIQLIGGFGTGAEGGVAYWAHIGGFIAGLALMLPIWLVRGGPRYWEQLQAPAPHPAGGRGTLQATTIPKVSRRSRRTPWGD